MATVTGNYVRSSGAALPVDAIPQVEAIPSKEAVTIDGRAISLTPQVVAPNSTTGAFSFNLIPTVDVVDSGFHYLIRGSYLLPDRYEGSGSVVYDMFEHKIFVPTEGGQIGSLTVVETDFGLAWQGSTPPPYSGLWLFLADSYDPASSGPVPVYTSPDGTTVEHGELVDWSA